MGCTDRVASSVGGGFGSATVGRQIAGRHHRLAAAGVGEVGFGYVGQLAQRLRVARNSAARSYGTPDWTVRMAQLQLTPRQRMDELGCIRKHSDEKPCRQSAGA
jgi:hypothetical protein